LLGDARGEGNLVGQTGSFYVFSYPLYKHLRDSNVLDDLCAFQSSSEVHVSVRGLHWNTPRPAAARLVSGNYFEALGVGAVIGRALLPSDDSAEAEPVTVVSYRYWKEKLGGNPAAIGSTVDVNGTPVSIVGVAPPQFYGDRLQVNPPDLWFPVFTSRDFSRNSIWRV
jgi:hypothetical protein